MADRLLPGTPSKRVLCAWVGFHGSHPLGPPPNAEQRTHARPIAKHLSNIPQQLILPTSPAWDHPLYSRVMCVRQCHTVCTAALWSRSERDEPRITDHLRSRIEDIYM